MNAARNPPAGVGSVGTGRPARQDHAASVSRCPTRHASSAGLMARRRWSLKRTEALTRTPGRRPR